MIEELMLKSRRLRLSLVKAFFGQISRLSIIMAGFQSGLILQLIVNTVTIEHTFYILQTTQSLKQTSDKTIQLYYNLGKVKTSEDLKKARENIIRWFFWTRFPRYRGKRRLGMIQKSPIRPSDVK